MNEKFKKWLSFFFFYYFNHISEAWTELWNFSSDWCNLFGNSILLWWNSFISEEVSGRKWFDEQAIMNRSQTRWEDQVEWIFNRISSSKLQTTFLFGRIVVCCVRHVMFLFYDHIGVANPSFFLSVTHRWTQRHTSIVMSLSHLPRPDILLLTFLNCLVASLPSSHTAK